MLDPNVAQSLTLTVAAANSASAGDAGAAAGTVARLPGDDLPFAAVLRRQLAQSDDAKASKAVNALIDARTKADGDKTDAATDAQAALLAWLAPFMAGVSAPSTPAAAGSQDGQALSGDAAVPTAATSALPDLIATPGLPGSAPALPRAAVTEDTALSGQTAGITFSQASSSSGQPGSETVKPAPTVEGAAELSAQSAAGAADAPAQPSAILAGADSVAAESSAQNGNNGAAAGAVPTGFDALLNAAHPAPAATARAHQATASANSAGGMSVATPVGAQGWDAEIGDKLAWMVGRQETRAELVLNPPQMGRIEVSISMNGNQANALFVSANPAVREALENAVPQLRESLQGAGISLGQAQVGAESFRQASAQGREKDDNSPRGEERGTGSANASIAAGPALRRGNGLIDTFA